MGVLSALVPYSVNQSHWIVISKEVKKTVWLFALKDYIDSI